MPRTKFRTRDILRYFCDGRCNAKGRVGGKQSHVPGGGNALRCRVVGGVVYKGSNLCPRKLEESSQKRRF